jgi:glycosyltransferase involved in cell wall biosynthesis
MYKILHIVTTLERGGAEKQLLILATKQVQAGNLVEIIFLKGKGTLTKEFVNAGCTVISDCANQPISFQWRLVQRKIKEKFNVVHAHLPLAEVILSMCSKKGSIFISSRHNVEPFYPKYDNILSSFLSRIVTSRFNGVVCISNSVLEFLVSRKEVARKKMHTIYYGSDEANVSLDSHRVRGRDLSEIKIGTIARHEPQKDLTTLLSGIALLGINENWHLTMVGQGSLSARLQSYAEHLGLNERINWIKESANVAEIYNELDIFALSSLYEGLGLVLVEAMQFKIPIIAARNSAIVEVLGKEYPYYFQTSNVEDFFAVLTKLIHDLRNGYEPSYRSQLSKFDPERMQENMLSFYRRSEKV